MIYLVAPIRHRYFERALQSIDQYRDDVIIVEKPDLTFSQTMNWIQRDAIERRLDVYWWMHSDAECRRDVIAEIMQRNDWDLCFTNYDALSVTRIAVAKVVQWDEEFPWYVSDCDYYRRVEKAGFRIAEHGADGVQHYAGYTLSIMDQAGRDRVQRETSQSLDRYQKKWDEYPKIRLIVVTRKESKP